MMLTRPAPNISTPDYIEMGDSHNPTSRSNQSHRRIIPLHTATLIVGLMVIIQVSYGYGYNCGLGRVINNGTDINARCEQFVTQIVG